MLGKHKGNGFELLVYKDLMNKPKFKCKRTIGSGSSFEPGDLHLTVISFKDEYKVHEDFYAIECKHLKKVRYNQLFDFWDKLVKDVDEYNGRFKKEYEPVIIYRQNKEPIMVMTIGQVKSKWVKTIVSYNIWKQLI